MAHSRPGELLTIFSIPLELTHRILTFCHPWDVAAFSRTCRLAHELIQDEYLWRELWHVYSFDDPQVTLRRRHAANLSTTPDMYPSGAGRWRGEFTRRMKAELIATMKRGDLLQIPPRDRRDALHVFVSAFKEAIPAFGLDNACQRDPTDIPFSATMQWLERVLHKSELIMSTTAAFDNAPETVQLQAHLRSCMGDLAWVGRTRRQMSDKRNKSRAFVYDLRNYSSKTDYGPFRASGDVSWVHVEHLINVVLANLGDLPSHLTLTRPPRGLESLRAYTAPGKYSPQDWAGVEGWVFTLVQSAFH